MESCPKMPSNFGLELAAIRSTHPEPPHFVTPIKPLHQHSTRDAIASMVGAGDVETVFLCIEASDLLLEPMCSTWELQQDLVPYVLSHSLQHDHFLKLPKAERQSKVKILTQRILSGETGAPSGDEEESPGQMRRGDLGWDLQHIPALTPPRVAFGRTYEPSNGGPDVYFTGNWKWLK
eukprot:s223_g57.t1